jgi:hypothetical protein
MTRHRLLVLGPMTAGYLFVILTFGRSILSLFGEQYATEYPALFLIAFGASISAIFSLAPTYMHFTGRDRIVLNHVLNHVSLSMWRRSALLTNPTEIMMSHLISLRR